MKFIQGHNRNQISLFPVSLDQSIDPDNEVRIIDLFVKSLPVEGSGFRTDFTENGPPAYHPSDLLKLLMSGNSLKEYLRVLLTLFLAFREFMGREISLSERFFPGEAIYNNKIQTVLIPLCIGSKRSGRKGYQTDCRCAQCKKDL